MAAPHYDDDVTPPTASIADADDSGVQEAAAPGSPLDPAGRYRRVETLGRGGMAQVFRVNDSVLKRMVAMKVLAWGRADDRVERERFLAEAEISAQLQHPGVVPVHDRGVTVDGRPWFTMQEVRGATLAQELRRVHAEPSVDEQALQALMRIYLRVCETVAFAHDRGIVHADLKPANLMLGEHGQVLVLDWGLARSDTNGIREDVSGTPAYLAPELLQTPAPAVAPQQDVYALGAVLYAILSGGPPYRGSPRAVLAQLRAGPPPSLEELPPSPLRPADLRGLCARAMHRDPLQRPARARAIVEAVQGWLDGRQRRARALAIVAEADAMAPRMQQLEEQARAHDVRAEGLLSEVQPFDPAERKAPAWALQEQAEALRRELAVDEVRWLQLLRSALNEVASLPEAHSRLADHYRDKLEVAEAARQESAAAHCEAMLRDHDRGRYAAYIKGDGRLTLHTAPAGATVQLYRYVEKQRLLDPVFERTLGVTPLLEVPLSRGSYLLVIEHPACEPVRYPVLIERGAYCDGVRPTANEVHAIALPAAGSLGRDDIYVPAGWFVSGGDPLAADCLPRRRLWVDGFVMQRHPVTNEAFLAFLNDLVDQGRVQEAERHAPDAGPGGAGNSDGDFVFRRTAAGDFAASITSPFGDMGQWPIARVDWNAAQAYAQWLSSRSGRAWQLPGELVWEKAARGADGRFAPWGDHIDPSRANMLRSHEKAPHRRPVGTPPSDISPYGVCGLAGNVRDWCCDVWRLDGPAGVASGVVPLAATPDRAGDGDALRAVRGGAWSDVEELCRSATRFAARPAERFRGMGFRLICGYPW